MARPRSSGCSGRAARRDHGREHRQRLGAAFAARRIHSGRRDEREAEGERRTRIVISHDHAHDHAHDRTTIVHDYDHGRPPARPRMGRATSAARAGREGKTPLRRRPPASLATRSSLHSAISACPRVIGDAVALSTSTIFHHSFARRRSGIIATAFDVVARRGQATRADVGRDQKIIEKAKLGGRIESHAIATFERLAASEARVHRVPIADVHFHRRSARSARSHRRRRLPPPRSTISAPRSSSPHSHGPRAESRRVTASSRCRPRDGGVPEGPRRPTTAGSATGSSRPRARR